MERWSVTGRVESHGERVEFGPLGDTLPAAFTATADYSDMAVTLTLVCSFDRKRVQLDELTLTGKDGHGVTPRDVVGLEVGAVVRRAAEMATQPGHGAHVSRRPGIRRPDAEELRLVAAVYWFHHVTWGEPRKAVMAYWDVPRTTANRWLRRCRELYDMPEVD